MITQKVTKIGNEGMPTYKIQCDRCGRHEWSTATTERMAVSFLRGWITTDQGHTCPTCI